MNEEKETRAWRLAHLTKRIRIESGVRDKRLNQNTIPGNEKSPVIVNTHIPLPPLTEQKRIVERIETIFASLDAITAEL